MAHWSGNRFVKPLVSNRTFLALKAGESNEMKVLRRLVQPRADGSFVVPAEIIEKFKDIKGGGREEVLRLYEKCGRNKDCHPILWTCISDLEDQINTSCPFLA